MFACMFISISLRLADEYIIYTLSYIDLYDPLVYTVALTCEKFDKNSTSSFNIHV